MQETQLDCVGWWVLFVQVMPLYWGGMNIVHSSVRQKYESEMPREEPSVLLITETDVLFWLGNLPVVKIIEY